VIYRLADNDLVTAINALEKAEAVLKVIEAEPFADRVAHLKDSDYQVMVTFEDPALAEVLLALRKAGYDLSITTGDASLDESIAALDRSERAMLVMMRQDADAAAQIEALEAAEATIAAINARDDADLLRTVRRLQQEELVLVITTEDGETTTANLATDDFIAILAGLEGDDFTVTFGLENGDAIAAKLQDPDFTAALRRYEEALDVMAAFNAREDAPLLRLVRALRSREITIAITTQDEAINDTLAAAGNDTLTRMITLLMDDALMAALKQLADAGFDAAAVEGATVRDVALALEPLPHTLAFAVDGEALAGEFASLEKADVLRITALLANAAFRKQLDQRDDAAETVAAITSREDAALIELLRGLRLNTYARDANKRLATGALDQNGFYAILVPETEAVIRLLSAHDDAGVVETIEAMGVGGLSAAIAGGDYTLFPPLEPDRSQQVIELVFGDTFTPTVQREQNGHEASATDVVWSPDGAIIASAGADLTIRLWEPDGYRLLAVLDDHDDSVIDLAWSPDGTILASSSWDNTVRLWDMTAAPGSVKTAATIKGLDERVIALDWSPDGALLAGTGRDAVVRIWSREGEDVTTLGRHAAEARALAWSPGGNWIVTGALDRTVRVWDAAAALAGED